VAKQIIEWAAGGGAELEVTALGIASQDALPFKRAADALRHALDENACSSASLGGALRRNTGGSAPTRYAPSSTSMWKWILSLSAEPKRWISVTAPVAPLARVSRAFLRR
jgi:hypothetical protein